MTTNTNAAPETGRKTRTITLTDRPPVRIVEEEWPIIAQARSHNGGVLGEGRANEVRTIKVRRHADGRTIVYGFLGEGPAGAGPSFKGWTGGSLLAFWDPFAVVEAIRLCAIGIHDHEIRHEVIANLPPEVL